MCKMDAGGCARGRYAAGHDIVANPLQQAQQAWEDLQDERNGRFFDLLRAFEAQTGCPVLVNTSFNVRGEAIVCTTEDAYRCFVNTGLDALVVGNYLLFAEEQKGARGVR